MHCNIDRWTDNLRDASVFVWAILFIVVTIL